MKIIAFAQLHNELEKGNLENWFNCVTSICDKIYIYDQNSTDGSRDYYKKFDNVHVIYSETNNFYNEVICKSELLETIKANEKTDDWIFWLDGDTFIEKKGLDKTFMLDYLQRMADQGFDGVRLGHYNLWRSDLYYRLDTGYHCPHMAGVMAFWRLRPTLHFPPVSGLHKRTIPKGIRREVTSNLCLIHRGFATDYQIIKKYTIYKERGQRGVSLERLLDENQTQLEKIDIERMPEWAPKDETRHPSNQKLIRDIYNEQH